MSKRTPKASADESAAGLERLRQELREIRAENEKLRHQLKLSSEIQIIGGMGSWEIDPETDQVVLSNEVKQLFGLGHEVSPRVDDLLLVIYPDDRESARRVLAAEIHEGESRTERMRLRDVEGKIRWVQVVARFGQPSKGPKRRYGIVQDISQLARTEHDLAESRERWKLAIDASEDGVWDWNLIDNRVHYSDRWKEMLGYLPTELENGFHQWEKLVHPDDLPGALAAVDDYIAGRIPQYCREFRMRCQDGTWRWILARGKAVFDNQGKPTRMLGTHTDITDRRQQEEAFKRLSLVASKTTTGVVITDAQGRFQWANKAFERLTGYALDEIEGQTPGAVLQGAATDEKTRELMRERVRLGQGFHVEVLNYRKSGVPYWVEVEATPVHDADGELESFIAIETDITSRRLDRERIEESERRFRDISNAAGEYIWETDVNGCFTYVTERVKDVLGYPPGEFIGMQTIELAAPEDREELATRIQDTISKRLEFTNFEMKLRHRDGHPLWQSVNGVPKYDRNGTWVGYRGAALDITRRKEIEHELSKVNQRFQLATDSARIGIWEYDPPNDRLEWDAIMHQLLRLPREQFRPTMDAWGQVVLPEDLPEFRRTLDTALKLGGNYPLHYRIAKKGEETRFITGNVLVLLNEYGNANRMIGSSWDITEQKWAEEKALQARDEAEAANRAKSAFLAMMSHEIRTPMNGVIGMIDVLADTELNADQREYLDTIRSSSESLMTIINDILDYSKVDAGRMELEKRPLLVEPLVRNALSLFAPHANEKKIELVHRVDDTVPAAVTGDETRLRQVLVNLISNAVKFTDRGRVTVKVTAHSVTESSHRLHFSVADTGLGLDESKQAMLFEPFTQADASTTRKYGGTGLGLAISKRLIELMKGRIWFESSRLLGTVFHFTIEAEITDSPPPDPPLRPLPTLRTDRSLPTGKVLVAEDNPVNRKVACFVLARFGYTAEVAENGAQAVEMHRRNRYVIILMDVQMPEMDGLEATQAIRLESGNDTKPWIIALSAAAMKEDEETALAAGMNDFITKPLRPRDLKAALERAKGPVSR